MIIFLAMVDSEDDKEKVAILFDETYTIVYRAAYKILNNHQDAEDVATEIFVTYMDKLAWFQKKSENERFNLRGYLVVMAYNEAKDLVEKRKRDAGHEPLDEEVVEDKSISCEDEALNRCDPAPIIRALDELTDRERKIIFIYMEEDHKLDVMLKRLKKENLGKEGLRSLVARTKKKLIHIVNGMEAE